LTTALDIEWQDDDDNEFEMLHVSVVTWFKKPCSDMSVRWARHRVTGLRTEVGSKDLRITETSATHSTATFVPQTVFVAHVSEIYCLVMFAVELIGEVACYVE
jgi:hypothetical protein